MKVTIKTIILILVFALITVVTASALNENDANVIPNGISTLTKVQSKLKTIKGTSYISRIIDLAIKQLSTAVSNPGTACVSKLQTSLLKLDQAAKIITSRSCANSKRKICIQDNLADQIFNDLQGTIDDLNEIAILDTDDNKVPDICDEDPDDDGIAGKKDNCPLTNNPDQVDTDKNGIGDICELFYCCQDSSLTVPLEECERKTISSCNKEDGVVIGGIPPLQPKSARSRTSTLKTRINFGGLSMIILGTGFFPFEDSQSVLDTFSVHGCKDIELTFTPPVGFPGGIFEVGPAANSSETGTRTTVQIFGDMSSTVTLNNFPTINSFTQRPFDPSMGDELGLSLFTNSQVFVDSTFNIFTDISKLCPVASSSGGAVNTSSGGTSGEVVVTTSSGGTSSGNFNTLLEDALSMSTVPAMEYVPTTYDCDDFANDLERELDNQGFDASFTLFWRNNGMDGHAVTDVHPADGMIIFIEPQSGMIIDLDEDGDGMIGFNDDMHSMTFMTTEGMSHIEVYMDLNGAVMAGAPID